MPRPPLPPRIKLWRGYHYLIYFDPQTKREVRKSCWRLGAHSAEQRAILLQLTKDQAKIRQAETTIAGGNLAYGTNLRDALKMYVDDVMARHAAGTLKASSATRLRETIGDFKAWVSDSMKTGQLDGPTLGKFLRTVGETHAAGTVNVHKRNLKTCLRWLATIRPRMFPDVEVFWPVLKLSYVLPERPEAFTAEQMRAFRAELAEDQRELFDLYALTGIRAAEVNTATYSDGILTVVAGKTGRRRMIPLTGAPEGEVAPKLARRMDKHGITAQRFRVQAWRLASKRSGVVILPQRLRKNFVSYCASMGYPAAVTSEWCGHTTQTSERFYRGQVLKRRDAASVESAMGL